MNRFSALLLVASLLLLVRGSRGDPAPSPLAAAPAARPDGAKEAKPMTPEPPVAIRLPPAKTIGEMSVEEALARRRSVREYSTLPISLDEVAQLLWAAQGITDRTHGFRTAPSAGALYPLEVYLVAGKVEGLAPGVYRYDPLRHSLTGIIAGDQRADLCHAALDQEPVREAAAALVISAVVARTAAKYGPRAERYCHMEAGHAGQNICLQAVARGLGTVTLGAFDDNGVKQLLRLPSGEDPLYILPIAPIR